MNKVILSSVLIGAASAAVQDIRRFRNREHQIERFNWGFFALNVIEGAITGLLTGLGVNQVVQS